MTEAKPATDEEITAIRMTLPEQAHQMSPAAMVMQLIARIDAERARVKVLEEAIDKFIDVTRQECCGRGVGYGEAPECCGQPDLLVDCQALDDLCNSRAALKEPANG